VKSEGKKATVNGIPNIDPHVYSTPAIAVPHRSGYVINTIRHRAISHLPRNAKHRWRFGVFWFRANSTITTVWVRCMFFSYSPFYTVPFRFRDKLRSHSSGVI